MDRYKTIKKGGTAEIIEKKSRFIATIVPAATEEEAQDFIAKIKKQYWDASHNCSAYIIGRNPGLERCSDDGEPTHTAGKPMLNVLLAEGITDLSVTVTRYFGGTLLGTGGLVRAYQAAVKEALKHCSIIEKCAGKLFEIQSDYSNIGKLQYIAAQMELPVVETSFTDNVTTKLILTEETEKPFYKKLMEATSGSSELTLLKEAYFSILDGQIIIF